MAQFGWSPSLPFSMAMRIAFGNALAILIFSVHQPFLVKNKNT